MRKKVEFISEETRNNIIKFYRGMKNIRICPGSRECVSVRNAETEKTEHLQKQVLLFNLKDLYVDWKNENIHVKDKHGFSFCASLRPRERVLAGSPGTHFICV